MIRRVLLLAAAWTLALPAVPAAPATSTSAPVVAFITAGDAVRSATLDGERLAPVQRLSSFSLKGSLLVGEVPGEGIVGYDARTGRRRFAVRDARLPIALGRRGRVAFWADFERDRQTNSVWLREPDGTVRKIVQFSNGPGLPGYDPGFHGDAIVLNTSFDRRGSKLALAEGNDVSLFRYDVFVVDVSSGRVRRITDDAASRWPSMSPDASRIAFQHEVATCGPDYVRAARLVVTDIDGGNRRVLTSGTCERWLSNPRWVSPSKIVAYDWTYRSAEDYEVDLVVINVDTGRRRRLTSSGMVSLFSVDSGNQRVAFERRDVGGFWILDLDDGLRTRFRRARFPHLSGERGTL